MNCCKEAFSFLIVDDDLGTRELLCDYINSAGHNVCVAENGLEAMNLLQKNAFDVVIIDWIMPVVDGPNLIRWIRSRNDAKPVHVVMLTIYREKTRLVEAFDAGVDDFLSKPIEEGELHARMRAWTRIICLEQTLADENKAVAARAEELTALNARLAQLAAFDELTGLPNRREAVRQLEEKLALSQRYGHPLACAVIDIDRFKWINDELGHAAGDFVLHEAGQIIRKTLRDADGLFRMGGDEFFALFPHQTAAAAALCVDRCRTAVASHDFVFEGKVIKVTLSAGIGERGPNTQKSQELTRATDESLYAAKKHGRNCLHVQSA